MADDSKLGPYRKVYVKLWSDDVFIRLSSEGKLAYLFFLTGPPTTSLPGLMRAGYHDLAQLRFNPDGDLSVDAVQRSAFLELVNAGLIEADDEFGLLVWLPKALKYNPPSSESNIIGWRSAIINLPKCRLLTTALQALSDELWQMRDSFGSTFDTLVSDCFGGKVPWLTQAQRGASAVPLPVPPSVPVPVHQVVPLAVPQTSPLGVPPGVPQALPPTSVISDQLTENRKTRTKTSSSRKRDGVPIPKTVNDQRFELFWLTEWPKTRRKNKPKAKAEWDRLQVDEALYAQMVAAVRVQRESADWLKSDGAYIPHLERWLKHRRFEDDLAGYKPPVPTSAALTRDEAVRSANEAVFQSRHGRSSAEVLDDLRARGIPAEKGGENPPTGLGADENRARGFLEDGGYPVTED